MEEENKFNLNQSNSQNNQDIILIIQGQEQKVDARFRKLSEMINSILEINPNEPIPLDESVVNLEIFNKIIEYCKMHDFNPPKVERPLKSGLLKDNLVQKDYNFIKDYPIYEEGKLKKLIEAACYLQIPTLQEICICRIATDFYFGHDQQSFEDLKKKLNITDDLTIEGEEKLIKEYPWIEQQ